MKRRDFLGAPLIALTPIASGSAPAFAQSAAARSSSFDPWIEVHAAHLRHNADQVARLASRPVLAVIKNNGYGLGVTNVARVLDPHPQIAGFAVVKLQEAIDLRDAGIKKPILMMGPFDEIDLRELTYGP